MADFNPSNDAYSASTGGTGANVAAKLLDSRDNASARTFLTGGSSGAFDYMYAGPRPISAVNYFAVHRAHLIFDLSGADAGTIESAQLCLYARHADSGGTLNNGQKFYVIGYDYGGAFNELADALPTNNTTGDWTSSSVPTYSSEITVNGVSEGDKITVDLNSTAITAINSALTSDDFDIGLVGNDDYKGDFTISTYGDGFGYNGVSFYTVDSSTTSYRPVLKLTYTQPTTGPVRIKAGARVQVSSGKFKVGTI